MACKYIYENKEYTKEEFYKFVGDNLVEKKSVQKYNKILFPTGNTASKVEGHTTLEEFKKQKEDRIKQLESQKYDLVSKEAQQKYIDYLFDTDQLQEYPKSEEDIKYYINIANEKRDNEINQLKQELERVEKEGFGALRPIYNFYENTVSNILKKQGYSPKLITDEYGNTWNEVTLEKKNLETILFSKKPQPRKEPNDLHSKLTAKDIYGKRYIQPIGSTGQYRILKDWKAKGLSLVKKLENEYPGVLSWKTVNNEVIISVNPQMGLKFSKESSTEKVSEDVLIPILDKLKARFNLDYKIINDPSLDWAGTYDGNVVVINSAKAGLDTPFHEFAHPFIRIIRNTNRPLYNRLVKEINDTKEGKVALEGVKQDYPELKDTDQVEEAIVTLIGAYAEDNLKSKSLIKRIQEFLQEILNRLGLSKINPKDLSNLSLRELGAIMASDLDVDISQAKQFVGEGAVFKSKKEETPKQAFEKQFVYFTRRIYRLEKDLKNAEEGSTKYNQLKAELDTLQEQLKVANEEQSRAAYLELGSHMLSRAEAFIKMLETDKASVSKDNLLFTINTIATFNDFTGLKDKSAELLERVYPFLSQHTLEVINKYNTEGKEITQDMIDKQDTDISAFTKSVGALSDLANYIGRTIGSLIKAAQNRASSTNKALLKKVQAEVDKLEEFAKSNNMKLEDVYNMMIDTVEVTSDDVKYKDLALVAPYINGKQNPKWEVLNRPENKAVKDFYNFYQDIMSKASNNLPYKVSKHHIPNIAKTDIKYRLKNILKVEDVLLDEFRTTEDLHADMVPSMFRAKLDIDKKSRDLGASILEFAAYSNMHHELSQALPEARLLQEQILYEQKANGVVEERKYVKSTDPKTKINAKDSYLYKMVDIVIDMQLKGKMTKDVFKPIKTKKILDENGEVIGYKQVRIDDALDLGLKYNSLLRIGLSPITALANVGFGDVSNIIESIGGRFFGFKELRQATNIFRKQIDYISNEKNSELYKWLDALNPLQELDDYNISDRVRLNKMTPEKAQEYMYALQKKGELFLQSRTMLAVLIKEKYMTKDGKTTKEGLKLMQDPEALQKMSDKIQRLNQMIHGRYSQREAATAQQYVLYRMMIQFRKWIPSAIEARFGEKQHDNRLGEEIEGRYRTFYSLITNLSDSIERLKSGKLTPLEIYNMKKNITEIVLLTASILGYAWLHGGDDEEAKKRRKNPYVKTLLTLTDRVSGDLGFFYNPANYTNLARNAIPLAKTVDDLRKVVMNIPYAFYVGEWEVKKGNLKGTNKFYSSTKKVMIGLKPLQDIEKLFNENPLDEFH